MSPTGVDLTVSAPSGQWRPGDLVSFTLEFRRSGRVKVLAVVVRPKDAPQRRVQEPRSGAVSWQ